MKRLTRPSRFLHFPNWVAALVLAVLSAHAGAPVITSFSQDGVLVCTNLAPDTLAAVEWASAIPSGPWSNLAGLDSVTVDSSGRIQVGVPISNVKNETMWFRVRGNSTPRGMVMIPAGSFAMGDPFSEGYGDDLPLHTNEVSIFYMDANEVSQAQWEEVYLWALTNGYSFENAGSGKAMNHPVHGIAWYDAVKWCNARSEKAGLTPCYCTDASRTTVYRSGQLDLTDACVNWSGGYRLATEAEWEKAARGGQSGKRFPWGDTITQGQANYYSYWEGGVPYYAYDVNPYEGHNTNYNTGDWPYTSPVGSVAANGYGLYDMAGNLWEWCWDWYDGAYYSSSPGTDPRGPAGPLELRVLRGGSWMNDAAQARCALRYNGSPDNSSYGIGFRCVKGL